MNEDNFEDIIFELYLARLKYIERLVQTNMGKLTFEDFTAS
ncbi:unnamed protein product [Paramecium pentaurelia]|uniref:Uncharacterized protein n=1 Tax=Paramecium pentaurelia TaxID=43138 RepID=A0A8S1WWX6_9CILI|nr:unnamed protein product [Paramecium pentaurelia]